MTALAVVFLALLLIAVLPVGVLVQYDTGGPAVKIVAGPVRIQLLPREKTRKQKKDGKPKKKKPDKKAKNAPTEKKEAQEKQPLGGKWKDFLPFVKMGLHFLGDFRRKLRVNRLELRVTLAGGDPADLAITYGRAWAAVGNLLPMLERCFVIKKRDISVQCDFIAEETAVFAVMEVTITVGRMCVLAVVYSVRALKEFVRLKNKKKAVQSL